jgi:hypothetical protein
LVKVTQFIGNINQTFGKNNQTKVTQFIGNINQTFGKNNQMVGKNNQNGW